MSAMTPIPLEGSPGSCAFGADRRRQRDTHGCRRQTLWGRRASMRDFGKVHTAALQSTSSQVAWMSSRFRTSLRRIMRSARPRLTPPGEPVPARRRTRLPALRRPDLGLRLLGTEAIALSLRALADEDLLVVVSTGGRPLANRRACPPCRPSSMWWPARPQAVQRRARDVPPTCAPNPLHQEPLHERTRAWSNVHNSPGFIRRFC